MSTSGLEPDEDSSSRGDSPDPQAVSPSVPDSVSGTGSMDDDRGHDPQTGRLEVEPLPYDGVASVAVGTLLWLVAFIVMIPFAEELEADGRLWWLATAAVGSGLGLLGLLIVVRRRARLARDRS